MLVNIRSCAALSMNSVQQCSQQGLRLWQAADHQHVTQACTEVRANLKAEDLRSCASSWIDASPGQTVKRSKRSCHADLEAEQNEAVNNTVCQALPGWQARVRCQGLRVKQSSTDKLLTSSQSETAQLCGRIRLPLRLHERIHSDRSQRS